MSSYRPSTYRSSVYGSSASAYTGGDESGYSGYNQNSLDTGSHASKERSSLAVPDGSSAARLSGAQDGRFRKLQPLQRNETHYPTPDLAPPARGRRHPIPEIDIPTNDLAQYDARSLTLGSVLSGIGSVASKLGSNLSEATWNYYNGLGFRPNAPLGALNAGYGENGSDPYYEPPEYANVRIPGEAGKAANNYLERTRYKPSS